MMSSAVVCGKSSAGMKFRRRTSSGSMSSSRATWFIISSIQWVASGRPAPRIASVGNLLVNTPSTVSPTAGMS